MNGSASPGPPKIEAGGSGKDDSVVNAPNGHPRPDQDGSSSSTRLRSSPPRPKQEVNRISAGGDGVKGRVPGASTHGEEDGGDSEAETLIDSPVKKKDAEKQIEAQKAERPPKHRIGSLPVPTDFDDENDSNAVSPANSSAAMSVEKRVGAENVKDEDEMDHEDTDSNKEDDSEALSEPDSPASNAPSPRSSVSRAVSERPNRSRDDGTRSPNPRKRKHRASSVTLPNKRPSLEPAKRRLRGLNSEGYNGRNDESLSPKQRSHRRTVSTQSAFMDGTDYSNRRRRAATQVPAKESKMSRGTWEESDGSSEATNHGLLEHRKLQRGVGRSTSTPGKPATREHKRYVNKYGFTKLAEACEINDMEMVREWVDKDPDQLELAEFAGNKPLQIAALNGNVEVVDYLIERGCQIDCANVDKDTPLIDAAENGHLDVVNSLLKAGVDPLRQNLKGQQALDVVTDEVDDADDIRARLRKAIEQWNTNGAKQKREEEEESRYRGGPSKELHFMARTYENLLKLVQNNDRNGVREFLDARVPVDNAVIAAAAKTGDSYLVNMLLVELPEKKRMQKPEKPLLSVLGTSHFEMVKSLTELDNFNPLYHNRSGKSWPEIAEDKSGPNWRQEKQLLQRLYEERAAMKERRSSSPVTKRDSGKRRLIARPAEDDSDEEQAPRRKNTRKLMSRRELRARGQATSDASSDDSDSEVTRGGEVLEQSTMKPPEGPTSKRTPTRSRTKSLSAQPPETSPRTRRRSSSLRGQNDHSLSTLAENLEDKEAALQKRATDEVEKEKEAEAEAEAEAKAKAAAVADQRAAEEKQRIAEADRKAEEQREAEKRRQAELEMKRKEDEAKRFHQEKVFLALPLRFSRVLRLTTTLAANRDQSSARALLQCTPLQVLLEDSNSYWVANVQAALLLDAGGIELLSSPDAPGFRGSLADMWNTKEAHRNVVPIIHSIVASLSQEPQNLPSLDRDGLSTLSFHEELELTAARFNHAKTVSERLSNGAITLRLVRLGDVLNHLHPSLRGQKIEVSFEHLSVPRTGNGQTAQTSMFEALASSIHRRPLPRTYIDGQQVSAERPINNVGTTAVTVVHKK